jgi:hypothetical protein
MPTTFIVSRVLDLLTEDKKLLRFHHPSLEKAVL